MWEAVLILLGRMFAWAVGPGGRRATDAGRAVSRGGWASNCTSGQVPSIVRVASFRPEIRVLVVSAAIGPQHRSGAVARESQHVGVTSRAVAEQGAHRN